MPPLGQQQMGAAPSPGTSGQPMPQFEVPQVPLEPAMPEMPDEDEAQERETEIALNKVNLAEDKDEDELRAISMECKRGFQSDAESMNGWLTEIAEWSKLARQVREQKTFPWPDASNIKYPLISTAALQFSARAYPTLVPADGKLVKTRVYGKDPTGEKAKKGDRIATYMSWQLVEEIPHWEEEMDKLLIMNAVVGQTYKKTYYDPTTEKIQSCLVYPENFVIDYWARSIESCMRYSEIHEMTKQEIEEYVRREYFLDVELGTPTGNKAIPQSEKPNSQQKSVNDFTTPYQIIEQHTWLDLDGDGLREPYMVWFEYESGKILRIQVRYSPDDIYTKGKKVLGFKPHCHYTKFGFIPNPDGSFFDMGFGHLLGPLNEAVNTNINQLTDSGTLNNLQAGFISKGLRIKMADTTWHPGEWKAVNATADDLRKQIVPLPSKEPSNVLFQLLNLLITSGKELASVAEIFVGKMPGQNTPATTTMASIEQGMKVFTAVYKRIYRSLTSEYKKIFYLNSYYLDPKTYGKVLDEPINPEDFNDDEYDVCPSADPTATTQTEKLVKAQGLMELLGTGLIDPQKVIMRVLQAQEQPNWEELIPGLQQTGQPTPPQEKPDPKVEAIRMKAETDARLGEARVAELQKKSELEQRSKEAELAMKQQDHAEERQHKMQMAQLETRAQVQKDNIFLAQAQNKAATEAVANKQKLVHNELSHKQKLQQSKETAKSKQSQNKSSRSGKKTR